MTASGEDLVNELSNLPYSVRQQMEQAKTLASQSRNGEAQTFVKQAATELARTKPELCALVVAAHYGYTQLTSREVEITEGYEVTPTRFLGIETGKRIRPVTTTTVKEKTWRLSGGGPGF